MDFKTKYLKYKKKYLQLKGGDIYFFDETLNNKQLEIIRTDYNPTEDRKLIAMKSIVPTFASSITANISTNGDMCSYINDDTQINWCLDPNTIYVNSSSNRYLFNRYRFVIYSAPLTIYDNGKLIDIFSKYVKINDIPSDIEGSFILVGTIFRQPINFFNSIYSTILNNMLYDKILRWVVSKTDEDPRFTTSRMLDPTNKFILIKDNVSKESNQIYFFTHNGFATRNPDNDFKIHMNVKLEYVFYVLDVLLSNYALFEDCLNQFKISVDFPRFGVVNQFSNRSSENFTKEEDGYIVEEEQPPNFVFYPEIDTDFTGPNYKDKVQKNVKNIINILIHLFSEHDLVLSSNLFPRMNFRLTNCIYFSIGDSNEKNDNPENFIPPTDYLTVPGNEIDCQRFNKQTKLLSNHVLYDEECEKINVKQYKLLNSKKFDGYSSRDLYKMIGQEKIYNYILTIAAR